MARLTPHTMVVWGLWQDGRFLFSTGSKSRKARNLAQNPNCVVCTEHAHEAVIVEGVAEIADVAARRKFLPVYEKKYKFDMWQDEGRHSLDERAGFRRAPAGRVRAVGESISKANRRAGSSNSDDCRARVTFVTACRTLPVTRDLRFLRL